MTITKEVSVRIGDRHCRIRSDDNYLDHIRGVFEPQMVELFRSVVGNSRSVLDIGANIGCTAILFGDLAERVHAFEPSASTYAFLQQNVALNGKGNVRLHNYGLGAESAMSTITFAPNNRSGGFVSNQTRANADHLTEQISIRTVDDVADELDLAGLGFIKIDVEGFEGQVLRGASATLNRFRPVVVLELNHWCLNVFQRTSLPEFFDQLCKTFPIVLAVDGGRYLSLHSPDQSYEVMYHHIMSMRFQNIVCAFDESQLVNFYSTHLHQHAPDTPEMQLNHATYPKNVARRIVGLARRIFN
jgi:FkbM family methyltransferase